MRKCALVSRLLGRNDSRLCFIGDVDRGNFAQGVGSTSLGIYDCGWKGNDEFIRSWDLDLVMVASSKDNLAMLEAIEMFLQRFLGQA